MEQPNLIYIHSLSQGDTAFVDKIIKIIKTELQDEKKIYYKNLEENNYLKTAEWVHKIKHKISILGLLESYAIAEEFEIIFSIFAGETLFTCIIYFVFFHC